MNILHVIPGLTWERGGTSAVVHALTHHQLELGHRITLLTTDQGARHGERPVELTEGIRTERLSVIGSDRVAYAPGFASCIRRVLRSTDVMHVHSIFTYPVHVALREAATTRVPVVLQPHGQLHRYSLGHSRWQKRLYLRFWGRMVRRACTAWHYTSVQEASSSWPGEDHPHFIVPNGIELGEFDEDRNRARSLVWETLPGLHKSPYVLFLGRLHRKKRLDLLVEAFLRGAPSIFRLVVAGPDEGKLWDMIRSSLLQSPEAACRVVRIDMVTGREKALLLAGASLFALSSEHENFGIAPLEALASGTPVLLSPQVDLAEAALAEGVGFTAPLTIDSWSKQLATLLTDPDQLNNASKRSRSWVRSQYSWSRVVVELQKQYDSILARCPLKQPIRDSSLEVCQVAP